MRFYLNTRNLLNSELIGIDENHFVQIIVNVNVVIIEYRG